MSREKYEVVISGVGGCYPQCASFHEFYNLLFKGKSAVTVDTQRWPVGALETPPATGKIPSYKHLDSTFFGMTPGLTDVTDPMTRMSLERTIEAVVDAGVNPSELSGANVGCIAGSCVSESEFIQLFSLKKLAILGANRAMQANRISFYLNLTGPSFQVDCTWVGGFQCLEQAKALVEEGIVDGCIVVVTNLTISPCVSKQMQGLGVLTQDEWTSSFSSDASGFVRSEAVVAFYIQRAQGAKRSYASLVDVDIRIFGERNGIFAQSCNPEQFETFLEDVYGRVDSNGVGYVEADGCGVRALDAMECSVLKKVFFNKSKRRHTQLLLGSVKSHVGHTEAASSLVSVSKALVALDSGYIPANLNYKEPNPNAEGLNTGELRVVTETTLLPSPLVGVTGLGLCSSFGHAVLKQHPKVKAHLYKQYEMYRDGLPRLVTISGRTEIGLRNILKEIKTYSADEEFAALFHQVFKTPINQHNIRGYVLTPDTCPEDETDNMEQVEYYEGVRKPIWFLFSGMGSQWNTMGRDLIKLPLFRRSMDRLAAVLAPRGVDLYKILTSDDKTLFDNILNSFVGIAACQIGLVDILLALGIQPDGLIGHSVGELGCAYADGCFTAEQMILAALARGKASIETDTIDGKMAAIGMGQAEMRELIKDKPTIQIACHNASDSCTLSGPSADIEAFVATLVAQGIFARAVNVANTAYHSRYIAPAAPRLLKYLKEVIPSPKARSSKWISTSILEANWNSPLAATSSPEYHTNNLLSSVYFEEASVHIPQDAICIEIAPHGLLQAILKRSLEEKKVTNVPLTLRGTKDGVRFLLHAVGKLYVNGLDVDISRLYPEIEFPVSRGTKPIGHFLDWEHGHEYDLSELEVETVVRSERSLSISITDHILYSSQLIHSEHVLPSAKLLLIALETPSIVQSKEPYDDALVLQDVRFVHSVKMSTKRALKIYLMLAKGSGHFEMSLEEGQESCDSFMSGSVNFLSSVSTFFGYAFPDILSKRVQMESLVDSLLGDEVFAHLRRFGMTQGARCECIKQMNIYSNNLAHVVIDFLCDDWLLFVDNMIKGLIYLYADRHYQIHLPYSIERLLLDKAMLMNSMKQNNSKFVDVFYDLDTSEIQCAGLHIFGLKMKPLVDIPLPSSLLNVKNLSFVPYQNPTLTSASQYALVCLQLLLENVPPVDKGCKLHINLIQVNAPNNNPTNDKPLGSINTLSRVLAAQSNVEVNFITYDGRNGDILKGKVKASQSYNMIICEEPALATEALDILRENRNSYLVLTTLKQELSLDASLSLVSSAVIDGVNFMFVKNCEKCEGSGVVFALQGSDWMSELKMKIEEALQDNKNIYIVSNSQPVSSINHFLKTFFLQDEYLSKFFELFKFFFILDNSAPLFSTTDKFYVDQLSLQLRINIYKDGCWGSDKFTYSDNYQVETLALDPRYQYDESIYLKDKLRSCEGLDVKYLCVSNKHLIVDEQFGEDKTCHALGPLEFAGTSQDGQKLIGLIPFDKGVDKLQPDPILNWTLPQNWTLEDGATIPLPYSVAYYILDPIHNFIDDMDYKYVLLSTGVNAIGLAFLNILLQRPEAHSKIFFCVKNKKHRAYIHEHYARHIESGLLQVFIYGGRYFEVNIKFATQGKGVHLVINCLSGRYLLSAINCLCRFRPRIVQLNRKDVIDKVQVSLFMFLQCTEFVVFGSEDLLSLPEESKKHVADCVNRGLKDGVVKPIPHSVVTGPHTGAEALGKLNASIGGDNIERIVLSLERERPKSLLPTPSVNVKYKFEADKSYLIIGGKGGSWLHLAEFLLLRGARHLLVSLCQTSVSCSAVASRKLHLLLLRYPSCDIQMTGAGVFDSELETKERLRSSCAIRELSAVFLLHMDSIVKLTHIHSGLQSQQFQYTLCISIHSSDSALCDQRKSQGLPTLRIQSEGERRVELVLDILDTLLIQVHTKQSGSGSSAILVDQVGKEHNDKEYLILQDIQSHLPETLQEIEELYEQMPSLPVWEEVRTLTARLADSKGSYPIFIIPGLRPHTKMLDKLIQKLVYPCFICKYPPHYDNLNETAKILVKELGAFDLQTFNLVAEGWGGLLALHIAKRLTKEGRFVRLTLLNAAPYTILSWVSYYKENLEINLLSKYFPLTQKDKKKLQTLSWEKKLSNVLASHCNASSLTALKTRLLSSYSGILNSDEDTERMEHVKVLLLRPESSSERDFCQLERTCAGPISIHVGTKPDYLSFLQDPDIAEEVNDNFLYHYPEAETPLYFVRDISVVYECKLFSKRVGH